MLQRLDFPEGTTPEEARARLDSELGVRGWGIPGATTVVEVPAVDPRAPLWWQGEEEASSSFLAAMGIHLTDAPLPGEDAPGA